MPYVVERPVRDGFDFNPAASHGLEFAYYAGTVWGSNGSVIDVSHGVLILVDNAVNYVERTRSGAVSSNTSGWTDGRCPLWKVRTDSVELVSVQDWRGMGDAVLS